MKNWKVIEDNGGGLTLVVFKSEQCGKLSYLHTGYEYNPGQLAEDISALKAGSDPATEWDGNELENSDSTDFESYFPWNQKGIGWEVIADNDGIYTDEMGAAGRYEFTYRLIGRTWESLSEEEREKLLIGAICTDGAEGNTFKNGNGTVDFINGLSVPGKVINGEIFIEPDAIIYNSVQ